MERGITPAEYRALAELRYLIRHFLREGDTNARAAGLEPQQYLMLLAIRGLPEGCDATIQTLAERLALKHHSAVELINRLESRGWVHRERAQDDRREVLLALTPKGERILAELALHHRDELRTAGPALVAALRRVMREEGVTRRKRASTLQKKYLTIPA